MAPDRALSPLGARLPWIALGAGLALGALALGLTLWSKQLTKEAGRAECAARAQTLALTVQAALDQRGHAPGDGFLARWEVRDGRVLGADPPPPGWAQAIADHARPTSLALSLPGGSRVATYVPSAAPGQGVLIEWDRARLRTELIEPALSEAGQGRYVATLVSPRHELSAGFPAQAQSPLFPPLSDWSVVVGYADQSATRSALRLQTALLVTLALGLVGALLTSVLAGLRQSERRAARARIREQFLTRATHELQTPLALLRASAETLQGGLALTAAEQERCLRIMLREEGRLTRTIRRLLRTLRWESGDAGLLTEWGPPSQALREAAESLRGPLGDGGIELSLALAACEGEAPLELLSDTTTELLMNALKHASGASRVSVRLSQVSPTRARLEVADDGPGFSAGDEERAFQPGARASSQTPGSGLGLALLREGWGALGGEIRALPGPGARFEVLVPLRPTPASPARATNPSDGSP